MKTHLSDTRLASFFRHLRAVFRLAAWPPGLLAAAGLSLCLAGSPLQAQVTAPPDAAAEVTAGGAVGADGMQVVAQRYDVAEIGAHQQTWNKVTTFLDEKGNTVMRTNPAFLELETGKKYWENGRWNDSLEWIEPFSGGAIARPGGHKVIFAENLNSDVVVDLQTPDGKRLQSSVVGLQYFDSTMGKSVLLGQVKDCKGQIISSNQVAYLDAFSGVSACVRYTYTKAGLEQDIILLAQLPKPEDAGLDSKTTQLQALTEFVTAPEPEIQTIKATARTLEDQTIDFGAMQIGRGKAFLLGESDTSTDEMPVAKRWSTAGGRAILYEEIPLAGIANQLQALPAKPRTASLNKASARRMAALTRPKAARLLAKKSSAPMQIARVKLPPKSFVLDWQNLTTQPNVTLKGDTTYYVSGTVNLSGTTQVEGGTVVKYTNTVVAKINFSGPLLCLTGPYRPAVFTSKNHDAVGEAIPAAPTRRRLPP